MLLVIMLGALVSAPAFAQRATSQPTSQPTEPAGLPSAEVTTAGIEARLREIETSFSGDATIRSQLLDLFRTTLLHLRQADLLLAEAARYEQLLQQAPRDLEEARQRLGQLKAVAASQPTGVLSAEATLEQVTHRLREAETDLASRREAQKKLEQEADRRAQRRTAIPQDLQEANKSLGKVARELGSGPSYGVAADVAEARLISLKAQQRALEQQVLVCKSELRCYQALDEILSVQQQEAAAAVGAAQATEAALRDALRRLRLAGAATQRDTAEKQLRDAPEAIRQLVLRTGELAKESESLTQKIHRTIARTKSVDEAIEAQAKNLKVLRNAIEASSSSDYLGMLLARLGRLAGDPAAIEREIRLADSQISAAQLRAAQLEEERQSLSDIESRTAEYVELLRSTGKLIDRERAAGKIREALRTNLDGLDTLRREYGEYWDGLIALKTSQNRFLTEARGYTSFIEERALWLPNEPLLHRAVLPARFGPEPGTMERIGEAFEADVRRNTAGYMAAVAGICLLIGLRRWVVRRLSVIQQRVQDPSTDSFVQTIEALVLELMLVLPAPLVLWLLASRMAQGAPSEEPYAYQYALAISTGLHYAGIQWMVFGFLRRLCRRGGIAEAHLQWDAGACRRMHFSLTWMLCLLVLIAAIGGFARSHPDPAWINLIGRVLLLSSMFALAAFVHVLLHPVRGALAALGVGMTAKVGRARLLSLIYAVLLALLFTLAAATYLGYGTLGLCLGRLAIRTVWLIFALVVLRSLLIRLVLVSQKRLASRADQERTRVSGGPEVDGGPPASSALQPWDVSSETISEATQKMLRWVLGCAFLVGLWILWQPFIPAFGFVNRVELWSVTADAPASVQNAVGGGAATQAPAGLQPVTLGDLLYAMIVAVLTCVLTAHGPKILEVALLSRLRLLDAGERFAIASLTRYVIVLVGLVLSLKAVGIGWSKVQWLAAAITLGLGFGLQEIFANFVSGLIILFERPVRIGDVVTVGGIDGRVTRIRMRAVTVTDWSRRELIVPNKEFITGQIVNWSLSDSVTRVNVPIGIAYGSNTRLARDLLLRVARECPHILQNPPPTAIFKSFGESTLNFELRAYIPNQDVWPEAIHDLHTRIDDEFRAAGIEIAFPQREIHVRFLPGAAGAPVGEGDGHGARETSKA